MFMLNNVDPVGLSEIGTLTISVNEMRAEGFEGNGSCRDIVALACIWGIKKLTEELELVLQQPGAGEMSID